MKAIWINPLTTGATSLDTNINPHDVDQLAVTSLLEREGFEVWLHDPFIKKRSQSSWERRITSEQLKGFEADVAILYCGPFTVDYLGHRYLHEKGTSRANRLDLVTDWLDNFDGSLYLHITDPRPAFQQLFLKPRGDHNLYAHIDRAKLLVADDSFLDESLRHRAAVSDYWKVVDVGEIQPFCETEDYFCVYPGSKPQTVKRKKMIAEWMDISGCYTIGEINIQKIESLSAHKKVSLSSVLDYTKRSRTALICGEPTHTWLTPRVIQSLVGGTVCSVHPDFAGFHWLPNALRKEQVVARASEFKDIDMVSAYSRQVDFVESLRNDSPKSGVNS